MAHNRRHNRVASLIQSELGNLILFETADPQVQGVSLVEVEVSGDLMSAKVYYHPGLGDEKVVAAGLRRAMPFFRRMLGERLGLRSVPELIFERDTHTEKLTRLLGILEEVSPKGVVG